MEKILNEILNQINSLSDDIKSIKVDIKSMQTEMKLIQSEMKLMQNEIKSIKDDIRNIKDELDIINGKMDEHHDLLDALEHRVEKNTAQLTSVSENVNYIKGDLTKLDKRLDHQLFKIAKTNEEIFLIKTGC